MNHLETRTRRADLDWLRVIAFGVLIYFHVAIVFIPDGLPLIQNAQTSPVLQILVGFLHEFRLSLLFLVSGAGVYFALRRRDRSAFLRERARRLLVPLLFGVLVVVPPMVYLEKRFIGAIDTTFFAFYPQVFSTGVYPAGNLSWHHYWFIAYLYLFCLLGWPLLKWLKGARGASCLAWVTERMRRGGGLYLAIVPLAVVEIALRAFFPGFRDLIHDWASFANWFLIFTAGFIFAMNEVLLERACALRRVSLALGVGATALLFDQFWSWSASGFTPVQDGAVTVVEYVGFAVLRTVNAWAWLLVCLGYAGRYLRRGNRVLTYLNEAVYPFFCLHLTAIVAIAYVIVPLDWPVMPKYFVIAGATTVVIVVLYECVRRIGWLRPLLGLKPLPQVNVRHCGELAPATAPRDE